MTEADWWTAMRSLFVEYCGEMKVPEHRRPELTAGGFLSWVQNYDAGLKRPGLSLDDPLQEILDSAGDSVTVQKLFATWPSLVTEHRGPLKNPLLSLTLLAVLEWEDGQMIPISVHMPQEFVGRKFNDGLLAELIQQRAAEMAVPILQHGTDALHKQSSPIGGDVRLQTFVGFVNRALQQIPLKEGIPEAIRKTAGFLYGILRPPVPAAVRAEAAARVRGEAKPGPTGGWTG